MNTSSTTAGPSSSPGVAGGLPRGAEDDVIASETWRRPESCQPGQWWMCPCGDIRPYAHAYCIGCCEDDDSDGSEPPSPDYHHTAAAALHAYAVVAAGSPMGATHIGWGASDAGARAVGETDATAWAAVLDALDCSDGAALNDAIAAIVTDTAFRVLGVAGIRGDLEMILRGYARSHELARDTCLHDHYHEVGEPCPRSPT